MNKKKKTKKNKVSIRTNNVIKYPLAKYNPY